MMYTCLKELLEFPQRYKYKFDINPTWPKRPSIVFPVVRERMLPDFFIVFVCNSFFWVRWTKGGKRIKIDVFKCVQR